MSRFLLSVFFALYDFSAFATIVPQQLVNDARGQINVTVSYDPSYRKIAYPMGDVPLHSGVCTDVVIRALRQQQIDLQQLVHQDMKKAWNLQILISIIVACRIWKPFSNVTGKAFP